MSSHRPFLAALATFGLCLALPMGAASGIDAGLETRVSRYPVAETVEKIVTTARARGLTVFAVIDHAAGAREAGLTMRPTVVLVIGNPKGGTPLMVAAPSAAIDLPLKILVADSESGATQVTFNAPAYIAQRHGLTVAQWPALSAFGPLLDAALQ